MEKKSRIWANLPPDLHRLTDIIRASEYPVPDHVRLDWSKVYPPGGEIVVHRWILSVKINAKTLADAVYLKFIRDNGFADAEIEAVTTKDEKRSVRFVLRNATIEEVRERI
jgi:hypothetical protein